MTIKDDAARRDGQAASPASDLALKKRHHVDMNVVPRLVVGASRLLPRRPLLNLLTAQMRPGGHDIAMPSAPRPSVDARGSGRTVTFAVDHLSRLLPRQLVAASALFFDAYIALYA